MSKVHAKLEPGEGRSVCGHVFLPGYPSEESWNAYMRARHAEYASETTCKHCRRHLERGLLDSLERNAKVLNALRGWKR